MTTEVANKKIVACVKDHPAQMSPLLLEAVLCGRKPFGRLVEKGLDASPHFGVLSDLPPGAVAKLVGDAMFSGVFETQKTDYPGLVLKRSAQ